MTSYVHTFKNRYKSVLALVCAAALLAGCDKHTDHEHEHAEHSHEQHADHESAHSAKKQEIPKGMSVNFTVSNYPLYLLSEAVTKGTDTTVYRLLGAGDAGHHGSLSPSDLKKVQDSKHVVWFGKQLESNLVKTMHKLEQETKDTHKLITLLDNKNITTLNQRNTKAVVVQGKKDPHVWLDPENAKQIVKVLTKLHSSANPELAKKYQQNSATFVAELDALTAKYSKKNIQWYWASHDAFQYLEKVLDIQLAGTLTTDHEIPAKASQILWLNKNRPQTAMCLLSQGIQKQGLLDKLGLTVSKVLVEDMSDSATYLQAWEKSAETVMSCLREADLKK